MSDLISREDLKKSLQNFFDGKVVDEPAYILRDVFCIIDNAPTVPLPDFKDGYKQAILDGKTNFSRQQSKWIPISERLPEENGEYLVTREAYIDSESGNMIFVRDIANFTTNYMFNNGFHKSNKVIAWQPLPELYKEGGAE